MAERSLEECLSLHDAQNNLKSSLVEFMAHCARDYLVQTAHKAWFIDGPAYERMPLGLADPFPE
jgi:hypothetical protein